MAPQRDGSRSTLRTLGMVFLVLGAGLVATRNLQTGTILITIGAVFFLLTITPRNRGGGPPR